LFLNIRYFFIFTHTKRCINILFYKSKISYIFKTEGVLFFSQRDRKEIAAHTLAPLAEGGKWRARRPTRCTYTRHRVALPRRRPGATQISVSHRGAHHSGHARGRDVAVPLLVSASGATVRATATARTTDAGAATAPPPTARHRRGRGHSSPLSASPSFLARRRRGTGFMSATYAARIFDPSVRGRGTRARCRFR
jgi:hypothetical protein